MAYKMVDGELVDINDEEHQEFLGTLSLAVPQLEDYRIAIRLHVERTAQQRGYDTGTSCASYANSSVPLWAGEATAFVAWRDAVWSYAFTELGKVQSGLRPQPTVDEIVAELPEIQWPV